MMNFCTLLAAALLLGFGTAQAQTTPAPATKPAHAAHKGSAHKAHDHVMMHDGKMVMMKGGRSTPMTETLTLPNGTQVMTDGTVMTKDGQKRMLKEGEEIGMDGKTHAADADHHKLHGGAKKKGSRS